MLFVLALTIEMLLPSTLLSPLSYLYLLHKQQDPGSSECGRWQLSQMRLQIFPVFWEQSNSTRLVTTAGRWKSKNLLKEAENEEKFP